MFETFDLYCERTSPDFWAEPVNALTNICFLIAAWFSWRRAKLIRAGSRGIHVLLVLICCIGIGSFLFHTFATRWARLLDVLPILLFQLAYIWFYCREIIRTRFSSTTTFLMVYVAAALVTRHFPHILNGSLIYAPAMMIMLTLGIYHLMTHRSEPYIILNAIGVFAISTVFRTVDLAVCPYVPFGTHFMWHILNPLALYLLLRGLLANRLALTAE